MNTAKAKRRTDAWYNAPKSEAHASMTKRVDQLRFELSAYRDHALFLMRLRCGSPNIQGDGLYQGDDGRLRYNLGSSTVDTAGSIVASSRPIPQCVVKGGDWTQQRKAKLRTRTLQTQAVEIGLYTLAAQAFDDACTIGIGAIHFMPDPDTGLPYAERVLPLELVWDPTEANSGKPRSLFRVRLMNRDVLKALYPRKAAEIDGAAGPSMTDLADFALTRNTDADQVVVYEGWHLPSSSKSTDGRRVLCVDKVTLVDQPWTRKRFPFGIVRWAPRQFGYLGRSLIEEVRPAQGRIHSLIEFTEECQDLGSVPRVWCEYGSGIEPDELDNRPMGIGWYKGAPPTLTAFDATPHDLQEEIDRIREQTWSQLGLTQAQIQGEKPAGVTSAIGLRTVEDISSRRHAQNLKFFEESMLDCFQALSDVNDDVAKDKPDFEVNAQIRGRFLEATKWTELQIKEGDIRISVFPISSLPTTPAGRYQQIEEWVQAGWMPRDVAMLLLGMPDLEAYEDLATADLRCAQWQVSKILDNIVAKDGSPILPDKYQNAQVAADFARKSLVSEMQEGAPEAVLQALRDYVDYAKALSEAQPANQQTAQQPTDATVAAQSPVPAEQPALAA